MVVFRWVHFDPRTVDLFPEAIMGRYRPPFKEYPAFPHAGGERGVGDPIWSTQEQDDRCRISLPKKSLQTIPLEESPAAAAGIADRAKKSVFSLLS